MTEGSSTYFGLAVPLLGESVIAQQTAATDILTVTGATSQTGDFLVLQDVSGNELYYITTYGEHYLAVNATAGATSAISFAMGAGAVVTNFLAVTSTNSPTYFLNVASSGGGVQANGFLTTKRYVAAPSTSQTWPVLTCVAGSKVLYIPLVPDTNMS